MINESIHLKVTGYCMMTHIRGAVFVSRLKICKIESRAPLQQICLSSPKYTLIDHQTMEVSTYGL